MAMPALHADLDWTVERALALPEDGNRYEVLDGELVVTPAPSYRHQAALAALFVPLQQYVRAHGLGTTLWSPADIVFSPRRLVQPDLFVVPPRRGAPPTHWSEIRSLLLAIEATSPTTARADRNRKRAIYMSEDVGEYWIVDTRQRLVERWRRGSVAPQILTDSLVWTPREGLPPFVLALPTYFDELGG
jgi:Uma2 family endonuclease